MIISFSIKNFKSIKDQVRISFEPDNTKGLEDYYFIEPVSGLTLLKLGLIYGANGSGKTTILEALEFLRQLVLSPRDKKTDNLAFKPFLFDDVSFKENSEFTLKFIQEGIIYKYHLEFNRESIFNEKLEYYDSHKALVYERVTDLEKQLSSIEFGSKIKSKINKIHKGALEANTLWNNTVLAAFLKTNFESSELKTATDWFDETLYGIVTPNSNLVRLINDGIGSGAINKKQIVTLLAAADFRINDIVIEKQQGSYDLFKEDILKAFSSPSEFEQIYQFTTDSDKMERTSLYFKHDVEIDGEKRSYNLPFKEESQGTQRYYQFSGLMALLLNKPSVFMIDELESSLHPDLIRHFLLIFLVNSKRSQLLLTTHYRELLLDRDILRDDAIWFSEKKDNGSMELYSLNDFDSSIVRNTTSIFNAYKTGKLGAVPELGDYYVDFSDVQK